MIDTLIQIARVVEGAFTEIESSVSPPEFIDFAIGKAFRYRDETIEAAIVQKCARLVSGINASLVLLRAGYVQELGAMFRMLDEFQEDILFLCQAVRTGEITELHKKYLSSFYQQEFDNRHSAFLSTQNRPTIPRKKIQSAISRITEQQLNESDSQELHRTLSQAYSGYVHAASERVMEMYGGNPPHFHVSGMLGTPRIAEYMNNAWDYFYRGLLAVMMTALTFKRHDLLKELYKFRHEIEVLSGRTEWEHPEKLMKRQRTPKA